jgi:hypothetical protein
MGRVKDAVSLPLQMKAQPIGFQFDWNCVRICFFSPRSHINFLTAIANKSPNCFYG